MKTLLLKNSEWLRGEGPDESYLLRGDGKRCCLGILARDCGIPDDYTQGTRVPSGLPYFFASQPEGLEEFRALWKEKLNSECEKLESSVANINDSTRFRTVSERLKRLEPLFNQVGYTLEYDAEG